MLVNHVCVSLKSEKKRSSFFQFGPIFCFFYVVFGAKIMFLNVLDCDLKWVRFILVCFWFDSQTCFFRPLVFSRAKKFEFFNILDHELKWA